MFLELETLAVEKADIVVSNAFGSALMQSAQLM